MRSWKPYLWKELRENIWLALGALGVFLGISFIPSVMGSYVHPARHWYNGSALGVFLLGGPLLALVAGVYATGRESGTLERFWRSRPINLNRWIASKYIVGLVLVCLVCWTPLVIQALGKASEGARDSMSNRFDFGVPLLHSSILLLIYSTSFMLGQCIRRVLHAGILAAGVMALIFIMPLVVAPLNWLSVEALIKADAGVLNARSSVAFAGTITALSLALLGLSGILFKRNAQIDVTGRTLGWSVAIILLVLAAGAAFPMGTNLVPEQVISLAIQEEGVIVDLAAQGNDVLILFDDWSPAGDSRLGLVRVHIGERTSTVGEPIWVTDPEKDPNLSDTALGVAWSPDDPSHVYIPVRRDTWRDRLADEWTSVLYLYTISLDASQSGSVVRRLEVNAGQITPHSTLTAHVYQRRLYIYSNESQAKRLLTFSLADPGAPSLIHSQDLTHGIGCQQEGDLSAEYVIRLVPIPDQSDSARLEITHELMPYHYWAPTGNGRILAGDFDKANYVPRLVLYEAGPAQDDVMPLHPIAQRRSVAFEGFLMQWYGELSYWAPFAYRLERNGVTAYHVGGSKQIERVGHYAAGETFDATVPLPNNRVVVVGKRLHVLDLSDRLSPSAR